MSGLYNVRKAYAPETAQVVGTYTRQGDGAALLLYSPLFWNDASYAVLIGRDGFRPVRPGDLAYRPDMESLLPGENQDTRGETLEDYRRAVTS